MEELILQEDDCAPDAREYFIKEMKNAYNLDFAEFKSKGIHSMSDSSSMQWHYKEYVLKIDADDPFYKLFKKKDRK